MTFNLINLVDKTMFDISANFTKRSRNKERFADSCEATIRLIALTRKCHVQMLRSRLKKFEESNCLK